MNEFDIANAFPFDKTIEMLFYNKATHLPCRRHGKTGLPVLSFYLNNQRS